MLLNFASKINALALANQAFFFIIDFDKTKSEVYAPDEIPDHIHFSVPGRQRLEKKAPVSGNFHFRAIPPTFGEYKEAFKKVQAEIAHGNTYLLNLTFKSRLETNLSLTNIFERSNAKYKLFYKDSFVVFSPETFVQISNGIISSYPMKGTIDATLPDAEHTLFNDVKESAEHNTIVDLIRNDLAMVSEEVFVERFKFIEKIKTHKGELLQMSSKICGRLPENYRENLGNILLDLLPAGSITGAPKPKTVKIIKDAENYHRGFYTGIFGYCDGHNLDSAVMIRFVEKEGEQLFFKSGGGITSLSDPEKEYEELIQKIYVPFA